RLYDHAFGVQDPRIWRFGMDNGRLVAALRDGIYRLDIPGERFDRLIASDQPRGYLSQGNHTCVAYFPFVQHYDRSTGTRTEFPAGDGVNDLEWAPDGSVWVATAGKHQLRMTPTRADTLRFAGLPDLFGVEDLVRIGSAMWMLTNDRGAIRIE